MLDGDWNFLIANNGGATCNIIFEKKISPHAFLGNWKILVAIWCWGCVKWRSKKFGHHLTHPFLFFFNCHLTHPHLILGPSLSLGSSSPTKLLLVPKVAWRFFQIFLEKNWSFELGFNMPHQAFLGTKSSLADVVDKENKRNNLSSSLGPISNLSLCSGVTPPTELLLASIVPWHKLQFYFF